MCHFSNTLFKTATVDDLKLVVNLVNKLIRRKRIIIGVILSHAKNFKLYMRIQNVRFKKMGNIIDGVITNMEGSNTIVEEIKASKEILALSFLVVNVTDLFNYNYFTLICFNEFTNEYLSEFLIPDKDFQAAIENIIQRAAKTYTYTNNVNRAYTITDVMDRVLSGTIDARSNCG